MDKYIGIDLGGSKLRVNDVTAEGTTGKERQVLVSSSVDNAKLRDITINAIENIIERVHKEGNNIVAIGYGSPGPLNYKRGIIETPPNLPQIKNLPIVQRIEETFPNIPAYLVHDADAALLGEQWLGAARNFNNVAMVTFGTGVGFAVVNDGLLVRGKGRASEAGHTDIDVGVRRLCSCGRYNHWEAFVSTDGLARTYCEAFGLNFENVSSKERYEVSFEFKKWLHTSNKKTDSKWFVVRSKYCDHVILGLRNILCNFDPECIILGGGIMTDNEMLSNVVIARWENYMLSNVKDSMATMAKDMEIRLAQLPNAGVVGAAKYAMDQIREENIRAEADLMGRG